MAKVRKTASIEKGIEEVVKILNEEENTITRELLEVQGRPINLGGYYFPDRELAEKAMRPSPTFNRAMASLKS